MLPRHPGSLLKPTDSADEPKEYYDGFGRTVLTQSGYVSGSTDIAVSQVDTQYEPCACSPLGRVKRVSRPYLGANPQYWTEYTYDQMRRTTAVIQPAGSGSTTYSYQGNAVTVTDPAGKWKKFEMDAAGNLTSVTEPDPVNTGSNLVTTYDYNERGQLRHVYMGIQTRTFDYYSSGQLWKATNPENGTVEYFYNAGLLIEKKDAKGQRVTYDYDTNRRMTAAHRWTSTNVEDGNQLTEYFYDGGNSIDPNYSSNGWGRLSGVRTRGLNGTRTFEDAYKFTAGGLMTAKRFKLTSPGPNGTGSGELESLYDYDTEGKMTYFRNPVAYQESGGSFTGAGGEGFFYSYNSLGQLSKMGTNPGQGDWVSNATYNVDGTLAALASAGGSETRTYNILEQLTGISSPGVTLGYSFPGANSGRVQNMTISGETVTYGYDALNRLVSATSSAGWAESYGYDRYGNLGNIGGQSIGVNQNTNRLTQGSYDGNGNYLGDTSQWAYDVENRLAQANGLSQGTQYYGYDGSNKRVWRQFLYNGSTPTEHVYFYGAGGRIGTYEIRWQGSAMRLVVREQNYYFGGKLLRTNGGWVTSDRLGSVVYRSDEAVVRKFRPYGQEYGSSSPNDQTKFGTYHRDNDTGLDYADQRYYTPGVGRFATSDPYRASAGAGDPASWNRYAYVEGDPVNRFDPVGLFYQVASGQPPPATGPTAEPISCYIHGTPVADPMVCMAAGLTSGGTIGLEVVRQGSNVVRGLFWANVRAGRDNALIKRTYDHISASLLSDADCLNWLSKNWAGSGPEGVRNAIDTYEHHTATGETSGATAQHLPNGQQFELDGGGLIDILVSTTGGFFQDIGGSLDGSTSSITSIQTNTDRYRVFVLLHELAHHARPDGFLSADSVKARQTSNNDLIMKNCGKTVGRASNTR